jgi:hypothetical protein
MKFTGDLTFQWEKTFLRALPTETPMIDPTDLSRIIVVLRSCLVPKFIVIASAGFRFPYEVNLQPFSFPSCDYSRKALPIFMPDTPIE